MADKDSNSSPAVSTAQPTDGSMPGGLPQPEVSGTSSATPSDSTSPEPASSAKPESTTPPNPESVTFPAPMETRILAAVVGFGLWGTGLFLILFAAFNGGSMVSAVWQTVALAVVGTALCWWGMKHRPPAVIVGPDGIDCGTAKSRVHFDYNQLQDAGCVVVKGTIVDHPAAPAELVIDLTRAESNAGSEAGGQPADTTKQVINVPIRPARYANAMTKAEAVTAVLGSCAPHLGRPVEVQIDPNAPLPPKSR